jgi:hypothetical protein
MLQDWTLSLDRLIKPVETDRPTRLICRQRPGVWEGPERDAVPYVVGVPVTVTPGFNMIVADYQRG